MQISTFESGRIEEHQRINLLQLFVKRILNNPTGEIIGHELRSSFAYLSALANRSNGKTRKEGGSSFVQHRPLKSLDMPIERFLASLRDQQRGKLDQIGA